MWYLLLITLVLVYLTWIYMDMKSGYWIYMDTAMHIIMDIDQICFMKIKYGYLCRSCKDLLGYKLTCLDIHDGYLFRDMFPW